jgi:hypothetical protein
MEKIKNIEERATQALSRYRNKKHQELIKEVCQVVEAVNSFSEPEERFYVKNITEQQDTPLRIFEIRSVFSWGPLFVQFDLCISAENGLEVIRHITEQHLHIARRELAKLKEKINPAIWDFSNNGE